MSFRFVALPFRATGFGTCSPGRATVGTHDIVAEVDLATGRLVPKARDKGSKARPMNPLALSSHDAIVAQEGHAILEAAVDHQTPDGSVTELLLDGTVLRLPGKLWKARRAGAFILGVVARQESRHDFVVLHSRGVLLRLPASQDAVIDVDGTLGACIVGGVLHVVRVLEATSSVHSVSLAMAGGDRDPQQRSRHDVRLLSPTLLALMDDKLLFVNTDDLPLSSAHVAVAATWEPVVAPTQADPEPATVSVVFSDRALVDHPKMKQLRLSLLPDGPVLAKGDRVFLDDVREDLPGILRVYAWRTASGAITRLPAPSPISLPAPGIESPAELSVPVPNAHAKVPRGAPDSVRLRDKATRHRFIAPPRLLRLLSTRENDPVFRERLDEVGWDSFHVGGLSQWHTDPNLVAFLGDGFGDEYCLYVYPPWCAQGREPPVVCFVHETHAIEFLAMTFDAWLGRKLGRLFEEIGDSATREHVAAIRQHLDLGTLVGPEPSPPPWLPTRAVHLRNASADDLLRAARERRQFGDLIGAERPMLEAALILPATSGPIWEELDQLYRELGWWLAVEQLHGS